MLELTGCQRGRADGGGQLQVTADLHQTHSLTLKSHHRLKFLDIRLIVTPLPTGGADGWEWANGHEIMRYYGARKTSINKQLI